MNFKYLAVSFGLLLTGAAPVLGDYVAYSVSKEGTQRALPENLDAIEPEYLVNLKWGKYSGPKTRIGVLPVENNSSMGTVSVMGRRGTVSYSTNSGGVPVQGIDAIITDAMHKTNRFRMVERSVLDKTLREQDLGVSGRIAKPSAARIGKVLGAQYLFQAVVTNYEAGVERSGGGLGGLVGGRAGLLLGGLSVNSSKGVIGMNFRLINAESSEIMFTRQVEVDMSESGLSFGGAGLTGGGALGGFLSKYSRTPIGQAVIAAINKGVYELIKQVGNTSSRGTVIKTKGSSVYINLGKGSVQAGDELTLVRKGEELIDPDTGISLGGEEETIGSLRVSTVKAKFSIGKPVGIKSSRIKRGDKVVSSRRAGNLEFAPAWIEEKKSSRFLSNFGGKSSTTENADDGGDVLDF